MKYSLNPCIRAGQVYILCITVWSLYTFCWQVSGLLSDIDLYGRNRESDWLLYEIIFWDFTDVTLVIKGALSTFVNFSIWHSQRNLSGVQSAEFEPKIQEKNHFSEPGLCNLCLLWRCASGSRYFHNLPRYLAQWLMVFPARCRIFISLPSPAPCRAHAQSLVIAQFFNIGLFY